MFRATHNGRWHRLVIEQPTVAQSTTGAPVKTWSAFAEVWGTVEPGMSREFFAAKATHSELSHEITIRYLVGIKTDMRVRFGDRIFDIADVPRNANEMNEWLVLSGHEIDAVTA